MILKLFKRLYLRIICLRRHANYDCMKTNPRNSVWHGSLLALRGPSLVSSQVVSIVDDDEGARFATASLIRSLGWQARVFASAEEFLDSGLMGETAFLISDIQMPGLSGIELHERLLSLGYVIPTILITAFPNAASKAAIPPECAPAFLEKPADAATVERLLTLALGTP
jgi:FixJ family two-component response regulator